MGEMSYIQWLRRVPSTGHCSSALPSLWWPGDLVPLDQSSFWDTLTPELLPCWAGLLSSRDTFSSFPGSPGTDQLGRKKGATTKSNLSLWVCSWALPEGSAGPCWGFPRRGHLSPLADPEHSGVAEMREILHPMELCPCRVLDLQGRDSWMLSLRWVTWTLEEDSLLEFAHSCL